MRVLLLHTDDPAYLSTGYAAAWTRALEDEGCTVERLGHPTISWWIDGPPARDFDLVIPHILVEEVVHWVPLYQAALAIDAGGAPMLNPMRAITAATDKLVTHGIWAAGDLPQPRTWALDDLDAFPAPGDRLVLKPSFCDGARHIVWVESLEEARAEVEQWRLDEAQGGERRGRALLQEWVEDPACVRIFATDRSTSMAYEKNREPGALVTSGTVYPKVYEPPAEMFDLATAMVRTLGAGLMGLDILIDQDGRLLALEANGPFGFDVTDPDQGRWVARAALDVARRRRELLQAA